MDDHAAQVRREMASIGQVVYGELETFARMLGDTERIADEAVDKAVAGDWEGFHRDMRVRYELREAVQICHGRVGVFDRVIDGVWERVDVVMAISTLWMTRRRRGLE